MLLPKQKYVRDGISGIGRVDILLVENSSNEELLRLRLVKPGRTVQVMQT